MFDELIKLHGEAATVAVDKMADVLEALLRKRHITKADIDEANAKIVEIRDAFLKVSDQFHRCIEGVGDAVITVKLALDRSCGREPEIKPCPKTIRSWLASLLGKRKP